MYNNNYALFANKKTFLKINCCLLLILIGITSYEALYSLELMINPKAPAFRWGRLLATLSVLIFGYNFGKIQPLEYEATQPKQLTKEQIEEEKNTAEFENFLYSKKKNQTKIINNDSKSIDHCVQNNLPTKTAAQLQAEIEVNKKIDILNNVITKFIVSILKHYYTGNIKITYLPENTSQTIFSLTFSLNLHLLSENQKKSIKNLIRQHPDINKNHSNIDESLSLSENKNTLTIAHIDLNSINDHIDRKNLKF
jgi:hypothetical protein